MFIFKILYDAAETSHKKICYKITLEFMCSIIVNIVKTDAFKRNSFL